MGYNNVFITNLLSVTGGVLKSVNSVPSLVTELFFRLQETGYINISIMNHAITIYTYRSLSVGGIDLLGKLRTGGILYL